MKLLRYYKKKKGKGFKSIGHVQSGGGEEGDVRSGESTEASGNVGLCDVEIRYRAYANDGDDKDSNNTAEDDKETDVVKRPIMHECEFNNDDDLSPVTNIGDNEREYMR